MPQDKVTEIVSGGESEDAVTGCAETSDSGTVSVEPVESGSTAICVSSETESPVTSSEEISVFGDVSCVTGVSALA